MLAPLKVPVASAAYTLIGLLLAKYWYDGVYWPTWLTLAVALALAFGIAPIARRFITTKPTLALRAFESYGWINGLLSAVAACVAVLVTVKLTAVAGKDDPVKQLVTQASTALTALIGGIVVATKDTDDKLGKWIAREFQAKFTRAGKGEPGKVALKAGSESEVAVFTRYANHWTDWSEDNRAARVKALNEHLAADRVP